MVLKSVVRKGVRVPALGTIIFKNLQRVID